MPIARSLGPFFLSLLVAPVLLAEPIDPVCHPTGEVAEVLDRVREMKAECGLSPACTDRVMTLIEEGLEEHPGSIHLERDLQTEWRFAELPEGRAARKDEVMAGYRALADEHPEDAASLYLAARATDDPDASSALFRRAVELDPTYPWAHLGVLYSHRTSDDPPDPEAERRHLGAILDRCPALVATVGSYARASRHEPWWRERLAAGREALRRRDLADSFDDLGRSWGVLYESTPLAEQAPLAAVVRAEIEEVEALERVADDTWWQTLEQGYELIGDEAAVERIEAERTARFPCADSILWARQSAWREENPQPDREESEEEERTRWANALWKQAEEWIAECPDSKELAFSKLTAANFGADLTEAQVDALADELLAVAESGSVQTGVAIETMIAGMFLAQEVHLDRVESLVATGLEKDLADLEERLADPVYPEEIKARLAEQVPSMRWNALLIRSRAAIEREDAELAREIATEAASLLEEVRPADDAPESERQQYLAYEGGHLLMSAKLAALEGRPADAAVLFARSSRLQRDAEEALEKGWEAWAEAGGSAEGWQALTDGLSGSAAPAFDRSALRWKETEIELPAELELTDLEGESWKRADFEGKTVFVNLWATWCGPCRKELPEVEKLYERTRGRDDVRVVTFNIDANPGAALRYAEKEGFTFPVLLATDLVDAMGGVSGIPRSWIVDRSLVVRREQIGWGPDDEWVDQVVELLDRYSAGEPR